MVRGLNPPSQVQPTYFFYLLPIPGIEWVLELPYYSHNVRPGTHPCAGTNYLFVVSLILKMYEGELPKIIKPMFDT